MLPALLGGAAANASDWEGLPVAEVRFDPRAQPVASEARERLVDIRLGAPLDPDQVRSTISNLFATGRYANIEAEALTQPEGLVVVLRTEPNWFVGEVEVLGVEEPPNRNQLVNATRLRLGQLYTPQAAARAQQSLRRLLIESGYPTPVIELAARERPEAYGVDLTFRLAPVERAVIGDVILPPDAPLSEDEVRSIAKWKEGKTFTGDRVEEGLGRLREELHERNFWQGEAAVVGRDFNPDANRINLILDIETGPRVTVAVRGVEISRKKLERLLPVFEEGAVDEDLLAEGARNLSDYLETEGYFDAEVEYDRRNVSEDEVSVVYQVDRGERQKLSRVTIGGELFFDEQTIRERLLIQEASLQVRRGRFSTRLLERDIDAILNLYRTNGFRDAEVEPSVVPAGDKKIAVHLQIEEGGATFIESLEVQGLDRFPLGTGYRFASAVGQPFSETSVATDRDLILAEYYDAGFQDAAFDWSVSPGSEPSSVKVEYRVDEGERLFVKRPVISGLNHTDPELVDEQVILSPGDPLSQTAMFESQRRLYDLGVFSKVEVALQNPEGDEPSKNVLFELEEARRWTVGFGGGAEFARLGGGRADITAPVGAATFAPRVTVEVTRLNFRGKGHTVALRTRLSTLQQRALLTLENPRWTGSEKWKMTMSALWDTSRNVRTFTGSRAEGAVQLEHRLSKPSTALYRYIYRRTTIDENTLQITPLLIPLNSQPVRAALLSGTYIQDRRDDPTDSTRGVFNSVDLSFASGYWGSQPDFFRFLGQNSTYHRVTSKLVVARTTQLGVMTPWADRELLDTAPQGFGTSPDPRLPIAERFFAGGANSHRGFPVNQAGPRDPTTGFPIGGGAQFLNSVELRFPLIGENIGGVLFHDAGNVFSKIQNFSFRTDQESFLPEEGPRQFEYDYMVHAVGLGLRYRTPVGPVRIDLAYSMNPPRFVGFSGTRQQLLAGEGTLREQRINGFQFHFSLGQTF